MLYWIFKFFTTDVYIEVAITMMYPVIFAALSICWHEDFCSALSFDCVSD